MVASLEQVYRMDLATIPLMNMIMKTGMIVNPDKLVELGNKWDEEIKEMDEKLDSLTGIPDINWNSSGDIARVIFTDLGVPIGGGKVSKTTGIPSADKKTLEALLDKYDGNSVIGQVMDTIIERRSLASFKSAWVDKALRERDDNNRIYTVVKNTRVVSGRWSTAEPFNFMAVPHEGETAHMLRRCFEPPVGYKIWKGDYSGIETRHNAVASGDQGMLKVFKEGLDIHTYTASLMFSIPYDSVDKWEHRYPAKRVGFGVAFGITPEGLMPLLPAKNRRLEFCAWLIDGYFGVYPGMRQLIANKHREAEQQGWIKDEWGRMRLIPEIHSALSWIKEAGLRQAFSHYIQGTAQGTIKIPMGVTFSTLAQYPQLRWEPMPQIHDELAFYVHEDDWELFDIVMGNLMANSTSLGEEVPLVVDTEIGENWGDTEPVRTITGSYMTTYCDINKDLVQL